MTDTTKVAPPAAPQKKANPKADRANTKPAKDEKKPKKARKLQQNPFSYTDPLQVRFVNCVMKKGKKTVAQRIVKDMFDEISRRGAEDSLKVFGRSPSERNACHGGKS